jgi:AhpD family alkylhydroperoxidase
MHTDGGTADAMDERIRFRQVVPDVYSTLLGVHHYLENCGLEVELLDLVYLRASMLNGCAYCIDMHWKDLRAAGAQEQKLYMLAVWRESRDFTARERAALEWTDAVTRLRDGEVSDAVYRSAKQQFTDVELVHLTLAVAAINSWNRFNVAFRTPAGTYKSPRTAPAAGSTHSGNAASR